MRITAIAVVALLALGCGTSKRAQNAIEEVLIHRDIAKSSAVTKPVYYVGNDPKQLQFDPRLYCTLLRSITYDQTPKDFQLAWIDYVHAWERNADAKRSLRALIGVLSGPSGLSTTARAMEQGDTTIAFENLERVAVAHGVRHQFAQ